jgi:ABC-2 type transport system permease protein
MFESFLAVFRKEFLHIFRDAGTLRLALVLPVMQLVLFGFIDQTVHDLPTVIVDQDRSVESRLLQDQLKASKTFKIVRLTPDPEAARQEIRSGRARVAVLIPPRFRNNRLRGIEAQVLVLIDGSDSTASSQALATVNGLVLTNNLARVEAVPTAPRAGMAAQPVILFNPEGRTANFIIPGLVAVLLQLVGIVLSAGAIVREREKGTFEQLLVTPIDPLGLMLGKLGPYLALSLVEMSLILAAMRFGFRVPIRGSLLVLYVIALFYLFALLSMGLLISTRAKTQMEAQQLAQLLFLPGIFLSGYIFPFEGMPRILQWIGTLFPVTHMIAIMRGVVLRDASVMDLWPHVAALLAMSVILVWLGSKSIKKVAA